jgi:hypothetical protein
MCRVRNTHTTAPWTTAYICITVDDSCTDENGSFIDKPMTLRMVQWQPYSVKKPFDSKTPVCAACKRTNRTRSFCRERHKHRQLPWCTVYVLLSALDHTDPSTVVAGASSKVENNGDDEEKNGDADKPDTESQEVKAEESEASAVGFDTVVSEADADGDDINDIAESRTFLAKVSCRGSSINWLELAEYDSSEAQPFDSQDAAAYALAAAQPPVDPNHPGVQYYAHAHYAAQQHQNALKSHQQFFFQMQQRHQQPYTSAQQPTHWQPHQYGMGIGHGESNQPGPTVTAGEAAAAQQRRHQPDDQQQAWAMYYQQQPGHHYPPPPSGEGAMQSPGGMPQEQQHEHFQTPPESENEDDEDHDIKRQRVV